MTKPINRSVRAFADSAGIGIKDEFLVEMWIKNPINRVVDEPVADAGFMDIPGLGIINLKILVSAVSVCFFFQFFVERQDIRWLEK